MANMKKVNMNIQKYEMMQKYLFILMVAYFVINEYFVIRKSDNH